MLAGAVAFSVVAPAGVAAAAGSGSPDITSPSFVASALSAQAHHKSLSQQQRAAIAVHFAYKHIGDWYRWGGNGPHVWDCSGLVVAAWKAGGIRLPRISGDMYGTRWKHVSFGSLQPGDVIEFYSGRTHVGLYVGGGYMIHAPEPGKRVQKVKLAGYFRQYFNGALRPGAR